eukprot:CAMPEP_0118662792 /NCGR_PEP_ID=MMETSP0785-20121206/17032_1 /TAXON_ID=91992 /ORGANISM="Bolidomonas pacifica, Strain CCMP 1866" /LENGTH=124 /DNA_ID=CAMNT_0006556383 /DNA_START=174 /DNA_END=545 /DNA_ORIENTATION=+
MILKSRISAFLFRFLIVIILAMSVEGRACNCDKLTSECKRCGCFKGADSWKMLITKEVFFTFETFVRGFLMGFGATIIQDCLFMGKRTREDLRQAKEFGVFVGLGVGTFLVGASVLVPRSWRVA